MKPLVYILPLEYPVKGGVEIKETEFIEKSAYDKAVEALKFYADKNKWKEEDIGSMARPQWWKEIDKDEGYTADIALKELGEIE